MRAEIDDLYLQDAQELVELIKARREAHYYMLLLIAHTSDPSALGEELKPRDTSYLEAAFDRDSLAQLKAQFNNPEA